MKENSPSLRALVAGHDKATLTYLCRVLQGIDCEVALAKSGDEALEQFSAFAPHVCYIDVDSPSQTGWLVCAKIKCLPSAPVVALVSRNDTEEGSRFASFVNADYFLRMPCSTQDIASVLCAQGLQLA